MAMKQRKRYIKGKTNPQAHDFIGSNKSRKDSKNQMEEIKKKKKEQEPRLFTEKPTEKNQVSHFLPSGSKKIKNPTQITHLRQTKKMQALKFPSRFSPFPPLLSNQTAPQNANTSPTKKQTKPHPENQIKTPKTCFQEQID